MRLMLWTLGALALSGCPSGDDDDQDDNDAMLHDAGGGGGKSSKGGSKAGTGGTSGDDRFAGAADLPACDAPDPENLAEGIDVRSLTLDDDTLVLGARAGIYTMPADGSTDPVEIEGTSLASSVAVLDGHVYSVGGAFLAVAPLPGTTSDPLVSQTDLDQLEASHVVSDGSALYVGSNDYDCTSEVNIFTLDGDQRTLHGTCVRELFAREGTVYVLDEDEDRNERAILKAGPGATRFETLIADPALEGPLTVSDDYVYFTLGGGTLGKNYLARAAITGGEIEVLAGPNYFDNLATDDEGVYFHTAFVPAICTYRYDEQAGTYRAIATGGEVNAWDDDYYYVTQGFVGGAPGRVAK